MTTNGMLVAQTSRKKLVDTKARKDAEYIHTKLAVLAPDNVKVLEVAAILVHKQLDVATAF